MSVATLEHDLDLSLFAPLTPEQIFYFVAFEQEEINSGPSRTGNNRAGRLERLRFYIASHCPDLPAPEADDLRRIVRGVAKMGWHPTFKYSLWAQLFPDSWWTFMNFGYDDIDLRAAPALVGSERYWKWAVQLYDKLGGLSELRGKDVLEVGSGRGGGANYLARRYAPRSYVAVDATRSNVIFSRATHRRPNLRFQHAFAEEIPLRDGAVDVVINVESCTYYQPLRDFASGVRRVLRPGGHLVTAFYEDPRKILKMRDTFVRQGLRLTHTEDISASVRSAITRFTGGDCETVIRENKTVRRKKVYRDMMRFFFWTPTLTSGQAPYVILEFEKR